MNKQRRKALAEVKQLVEDFREKASSMADDIRSALETLRDEEQEYYDNMSDSMKDGDKGSASQGAIDALEQALSELEDIDLDKLETIASYIDEAAQ